MSALIYILQISPFPHCLMAVIASQICEWCNQEALVLPQSTVLSAEIGQVDWATQEPSTHSGCHCGPTSRDGDLHSHAAGNWCLPEQIPLSILFFTWTTETGKSRSMWILCMKDILRISFDCFWTKNHFLHENQWMIWNSFTISSCAMWTLWDFDSVGRNYCRVPYFLLWDGVYLDIKGMSAMDDHHGRSIHLHNIKPFSSALVRNSCWWRLWRPDLTS